MIKKYSQFLITFFQTSDLKLLNYCNYFPPKGTHSLSTIIETFKKHLSIPNIKKRNLDAVFSFRKTTQEEVSKVIRYLKTKKKLSDEWFFHQSLQTF